MMALIKQMNDFFVLDSHIQDFSGMPDPNGTAVVINSVQSYYFFIYININIKRAHRTFTVNN